MSLTIISHCVSDDKCETAAAAIENIADAVTHARFVGTDQSTDEVVLMKILHVSNLQYLGLVSFKSRSFFLPLKYLDESFLVID